MNVQQNRWDNPPFDFWNSPTRWPLTPDKDGLLFLATAVNRIGGAIYPDWGGREPWMQAEPIGRLLPAGFERLSVENIVLGRMLLALPEPIRFDPLSPWEDIDRSRAKPDLRPLSDGEWRLAIDKRDALQQQMTAAQSRWDEVLMVSFVLLKTGNLQTRLRPARGGDYIEPPSGLWNTDLAYARPRFAMCQVDLARPFDQQEYIAPPGSARQFHLIFVTTASLEASLNLIRDQIDAKDRAKANGGPRPARVVKEEDQAAQFFFDTMNASPGERTVDKAELERQALQRWPDLGKNALRRARAKAIALGKGRFTAWGEGGKPAGQN